MISAKRLLSLAFAAVAFAFATATAQAQQSPATPAPAPQSTPTIMDRAYDGQVHVTFVPYLWLPTIRSNVQYNIPKLPNGIGPAFSTNVQVGPSDYLTSLNSAGEFAFNVRKGDGVLLGDYIFANLSSSATAYTTISGPGGKLKIPASIVTNSRLATSIWELAGGFALAHGHNADLNLIVGWRQFPLTTNLAYTATIGSKRQLTKSGTIKITPLANDVVFGFQGRAFTGDGRWFAPYYIDIGSGANQSTWEAYGGAGYAFPHGQSVIVAFRTLNYYGFAPESQVKKLSMWGPLFGYTFGL